MVKFPVLAVEKGKGLLIYLEFESREGKGSLYLDSKLETDQEARKTINTAFSLLGEKKKDVLIRLKDSTHNCLCGPSLGLPIYLGMYACVSGLKIKPRIFSTGRINRKGNVGSVGGLAEKIKAVLGKADKLLVPKGQGLPIRGMEVVEISTVKEATEIALVN